MCARSLTPSHLKMRIQRKSKPGGSRCALGPSHASSKVGAKDSRSTMFSGFSKMPKPNICTGAWGLGLACVGFTAA